MTSKNYRHKVTLGEKRRQNKKISDIANKGGEKRALQSVFDTYYKDQVRALYRAVASDN